MTVGTDGNDAMTGTAGNDLLEGLAGDDNLNGGGGTDQTRGGAGNDTHYVDRSTDLAIEAVGEGYDTVQSSATYTLGAHIERLVLSGTAAINGTGNDLANVIVGNSAANHLNGGAGADQMRGGGGDDTYYVDHAYDGIFEISPADGFDQVRSSISFSLGSYLEKLVLTGTNAINGNGNILANVLIGNSAGNGLNGGQGADQMRGGGGDDTYVVDNAGDQVFEISAADGFDHVKSSVSFSLGSHVEKLTLTGAAAIDGNGNSLANILLGNSADNVLNGGGDADQMRGGDGNDTYVVDNGGDQIFEIDPTHGTDLVRSSVSFSLGAYLENLVLTGGAAIDGNGNTLANSLTGNGAANVLNGGGGGDTMIGGGGNDTYVVDNEGDQVVETSAAGGVDQVRSSASFALGTNFENLTLTGAGAVDGTGNGGANVITGNSGANILNGGDGSDSLSGGSGSDIFAFTNAPGAGNIDLVLDFNPAADTIRLGGAGGQPFAALATGALAAGAFHAGNAAADIDDRILYDSATGALLYDADGLGGAAAIQFATLDPGLTLTAADFVTSGPANQLPTISSGSTASVAENSPTSTIVYQTIASDSDGDSFVYSLTGTDASRFSIDQNGAVRFVASPDFELDSSYSFTVNAQDSSGNGAARAVTLSVTNVSEAQDPYFVAETAAANNSRSSAQWLDRGAFTATDSPNVPNDSLPTAIITGSVSSFADVDYYRIDLHEGELLILDVDGTSTLDAFVSVFDASGQEIAFNDDLGTFDPGSTAHPGVDHNMDSFVKIRAPTDSTYYIAVQSFEDPDHPSAGDYRLNVSIGPPASQAQIDLENIQALLDGTVWSDFSLTYGFTSSAADYGPGQGTTEIAAGMSPLTGQQEAAVATILPQIARLTNLTFTELAANPGAADLRYARSNDPGTAHAYVPGPGDGGDSWYNTTNYSNPVIGNYQWMAFVHETGHALGLKHGHEAPALSPDRDSLEFSLMTYRSYIGAPVDEVNGGYTNETNGYPQTLMMYDIGALQEMYGADFSFNSGNTTYSWNATTGAFSINGAVQWTPGGNRVFMTIWDGNGVDTFDLSNYSGATIVDLRPGMWSTISSVQIANLGDSHQARGNVFNALLYNDDPRSLIENAIGGSSVDMFTANRAVNHFTGNAGNDTFRFMSVDDSRPGAADVLMDFARGSDRIDLTAIDGHTQTPGHSQLYFIGTDAFSVPEFDNGQIRYDVVGSAVHIFGDTNADLVADFQLIVNNVAAVDLSDFWF